ncbi:MAG: methylated-DNA--[protein]-cysteine S-methyltransferase [Syntrophobacteraceae bacterium]
MNRKLRLKYITFETPLGWLVVAESPDGIALVNFLGRDCPTEDAAISSVLRTYPDATVSPGGDSVLLGKTKAYILAYLTNRAPVPKVPLDLRKGTGFDRNVWTAIETIAFGESQSYSQIAAKVNSTGASRAVGRACGRNPVPILIPCHRVIGSGGKLGGYSGGLDIKRALLDLEKS